MVEIEFRNVTKRYEDGTEAVSTLNLRIKNGEFLVLLGPSGCGKTTLLRCIAGLEVQSSGTIIQNSEIISDLPTSQRDFGIVFQS